MVLVERCTPECRETGKEHGILFSGKHDQFVLGVNSCVYFFFFSSRRRHTRCSRDWSSACALPIWATACGLPAALSVIVSVALRAPTPAGVKRRLSVRLAPAARVFSPPSLTMANSPRFPPATVRLRSEERRVGKECRARWEAER